MHGGLFAHTVCACVRGSGGRLRLLALLELLRLLRALLRFVLGHPPLVLGHVLAPVAVAAVGVHDARLGALDAPHAEESDGHPRGGLQLQLRLHLLNERL